MTKEDIEKEVQARVNHKLNELITVCTNMANTNYWLAFKSNHPKYVYYMDAFKQFKQMMIKEKNMPLPIDHLVEAKKREQRNKAVDKLSDRLLKRGAKDYYYLQGVINDIIEDAQNY